MNVKTKGRTGEFEVRDLLQQSANKVTNGLGLAPLVIERNVDQVRSALGNEKGSDLIGLPWFAIEVKRQENDGAFNGWWEQCKQAAWVWDEKGADVGAGGRRGRFAREPVLFSRKNRAGWDIRLFAYLLIDNGMRVRVPVDINLPHFLLYFENRIAYEMMKDVIDPDRKVGNLWGGVSKVDEKDEEKDPTSPTLPSSPQNIPQNTPEFSQNLLNLPPFSLNLIKFDSKTGAPLEAGIQPKMPAPKKPWET